MFYVLTFTFYLLAFTFYCCFTFYLLPFTFGWLVCIIDVHGSWLMAGKSLVSLAALLVEILDMTEEGGEGGEVQVITEVTLNLWVWGFRVEPIYSQRTLLHRVKPVSWLREAGDTGFEVNSTDFKLVEL